MYQLWEEQEAMLEHLALRAEERREGYHRCWRRQRQVEAVSHHWEGEDLRLGAKKRSVEGARKKGYLLFRRRNRGYVRVGEHIAAWRCSTL